MTALTGRRLTDEERNDVECWPVDCTEAVTRTSRGDTREEPCDKVAVAVRFDPEFGGAYPVCARHARGEMASLADLLGLAEFHGGVTQTERAS